MFRILIVFCVFFLQCTPNNSTLKDTLTIAIDSEPKTLDPRKSTEAYGIRIINLLFQGLVKIGPDLKILPDGAKSWSQKGLSYTFLLNRLVFANGREVTPEDIEFSFQEFRKNKSPFASSFKNIKSIKAWKNKTYISVRIQLKKPSATFLSGDLPVLKILPKKEIKKSPIQFLKKPFGTGAFVLINKNSQSIVLKRREPKEGYPLFLSFLVLRDSVTRVQKVLRGDIDIAPSVIPLKKISLFSKDKFEIRTNPSLSTNYVLLNLKNKNLKQKDLRKALSLSLNRDDVIRYQLKGYGTPATSFLNPHYFIFNKHLKVQESKTQAQKIINQLGLKGEKLTLSVSNNQNTVEKARILISQWNQAGLHASFESYEWGAFYQKLNKGHFEMALMKWVGVTDPDIYRIAFHSDNLAPLGRNRSFYKNNTLDNLLEKGLTTLNKPSRNLIYKKAQNIIFDNYIAIPLWHETEVSITKKSISEYRMMLNGGFDTLSQIKK